MQDQNEFNQTNPKSAYSIISDSDSDLRSNEDHISENL